MKRKGMMHVVFATLAVSALAGISAQAAHADEYYRTYTSTSTWTTPSTIMVERPMTIERVVESPAVIERVVERPAMVERVVERPATVERVVERPVFVEKTVEKPVIIEKEITRPIRIEDRVLDDHLLKLDLFHLMKFGAL